MEKLLKKGHSCIIKQFNIIKVVDTLSENIHHDLYLVLSKHQHVFETPKGLPLASRKHECGILFILGSQLANIRPYEHPFSQNNEIEKII